MDPMLIAETLASAPVALFAMLGSLPPAVWVCVAFSVVAGMLTRVLDA